MAGRKVWLPGWLASIVQVPADVKLTTPVVSVQIELLMGSTVKATVRPEVAVAIGV